MRTSGRSSQIQSKIRIARPSRFGRRSGDAPAAAGHARAAGQAPAAASKITGGVSQSRQRKGWADHPARVLTEAARA